MERHRLMRVDMRSISYQCLAVRRRIDGHHTVQETASRRFRINRFSEQSQCSGMGGEAVEQILHELLQDSIDSVVKKLRGNQ